MANYLLYITIIIPWIVGIALAQGTWSIIGACFLPPYAWVLVAKYLLGL